MIQERQASTAGSPIASDNTRSHMNQTVSWTKWAIEVRSRIHAITSMYQKTCQPPRDAQKRAVAAKATNPTVAMTAET